MNKEILSIKPISLELNESNDIYMLLNIGILSSDVNYNNAQFTKEFMDYIVENKNTYIGLPLQVNKEKLENAEYDDLTHELIGDELKTDSIGSFVDYWVETDSDGVHVLMSSIKVWKRYPNTCSAILELYQNGELESSCEVMVKEYKEITSDGVRVIDHADGKNSFIGSAIVSNPAEVRAKATLLVAEAYNADLQNIKNEKKGEKELAEKELFNKGFKTKFHIEVSELSHEDIRQQIYNVVNPVNPVTEQRSYKYWIREVFQTYIIVEEWDDSNKLYKIDYSLNEDTVVLASDWQQVEITYQVVGTDINGELSKLQTELNSTKEELSKMDKTSDEKVVELQSKIEELEAKVTELNSTIVEQQEGKTALESQITELNSTIVDLNQYKEKVETAEKEAQITELNEKYSKLISEETFKTEEVQNAIQELNSQKLNEIVVSEVAKSKTITEVNSTNNKDIIVNAKQGEDLIPKTILQKYNIKA